MNEAKPLTTEHIRVLKILCEKYPDSDIARAIATVEQRDEQLKRLREELAEAADRLDARGHRFGAHKAREALAAVRPPK